MTDASGRTAAALGHPTFCPLDCPDTCALDVEVTKGRVVAIRGRRDHPDTAGFICTKVSRFGRRLTHPARLVQPLRRVGGKGDGHFEPISWDDAIGEIVARFREIIDHHGAESILPFSYGGSNGYLTDGLLDTWFFARLGASRLKKTICAVPTRLVAEGMYGRMPGVPFGDYPDARCVIVWGANPKASNIHLVPYLKAAKANGASVIVVDPIRNFTAREADLHLPILPGTDLPVALSMIRLWEEWGALDTAFLAAHARNVEPLLEAARAWPVERAAQEADVPPADIEHAARRYAEASPAVIRCGWGLERNRNGGQAVAAVLAMPALLGKFGVRAGGYTASNRGHVRYDPADVIGNIPWETRSVNMTQLGAALENADPPIKALFVFNANPAATVPNQERVLRGLKRADLFTVVHDQVLTDTAAFADIVLPATTFLEHHDVRAGYGSYVLGRVAPIIAPEGEARSNPWVFAELARRMGWSDVPGDGDDATLGERIVDAIRLNGEPVSRSAYRAGEAIQPRFSNGGPVQFESVHPRTPDGKVDVTPACLGQAPYRYEPPMDTYPLALVSPANGKMITSMLGEFNYPELKVTLHPGDARDRDIRDGATVRVFNDQGEVLCRAELSSRLRPGVVSMPKGAWRQASRNGWTSTALCPDHVQVVGDAACFNDARVEIAIVR